jgi:hypothetical protein
MALFCPRCGDELRPTADDSLQCERGQMVLALALARSLRECYQDELRLPKQVVFTHKGAPHPIGGTWFCPGCGVRIPEDSPGALTCPLCSRSVVEFVVGLVERHSHV